jgi:hypothetical protein
MIRNYNHLQELGGYAAKTGRLQCYSYHEIFFDHHPLKVRRFGRRSSKRGTVPHRFHD